MDNNPKPSKVTKWMRAHPGLVTWSVIAASSYVGYRIGVKHTNMQTDRFLTGWEDSVQRAIDEFGEAHIKVTAQGYKWVVKNLD